jgi:cytochrome c-type biogenesis protein CcmH
VSETLRKVLAGLITLALAGIVVAGIVMSEDKEPTAEDRARSIAAQVRCPVCQGESILDSNAGMARDMFALVEEEVAKGTETEEIFDLLAAGFGEGILLNPRGWAQIVLFALAGIAVLAGGGLILGRFRRRSTAAEEPPR